ncbi:DUF4365 domain-containing protein [Rhodoplanes serenus]|uniref:DUF4365 domain-containing protein n=1 Tax=Rhodoplanes serenus TaxID=200615 RepID=A0A9X5AU38_9BRAD|nr:DUF4365 domain-containing protein [Rhodoplanes serenus]MTW18019.1 DUF4365 domain-containing protein [Rhodoplanes serenus]
MALPDPHLLDELATAYIQIMAAAAGAVIAVSRLDYGVDGTLKLLLHAAGNRYIESGYPVDFQLKGTTVASATNSDVVYDLNARNHDLLVARPVSATPYFLFLVCFPMERDNWLVAERERLILNAAAYWWSETGAPTGNRSTVRIKIPRERRLTPGSISAMLEGSRDRFA